MLVELLGAVIGELYLGEPVGRLLGTGNRLAQGGLVLLPHTLVHIGLNTAKQVALFHRLPFYHGELDNFARHLGADFHLKHRLDTPVRGGELGYILPRGVGVLHLKGIVGTQSSRLEEGEYNDNHKGDGDY